MFFFSQRLRDFVPRLLTRDGKNQVARANWTFDSVTVEVGNVEALTIDGERMDECKNIAMLDDSGTLTIYGTLKRTVVQVSSFFSKRTTMEKMTRRIILFLQAT
jgi:hypothetical protein